MSTTFLGLSWRAWGALATASWLGVFAAAWFGVSRAWAAHDDPTSLWVPGISLGLMALANALPGATAVLNPVMRQRFLGVPAAAALSSMTVAALAGIISGMAVGLAYGQEASLMGAGIILGIMIFPLTFGMVFPLAIPLLCSLLAWSLAGRDGGMSSRTYTLLTGISAIGWCLVVLVGMALGLA